MSRPLQTITEELARSIRAAQAAEDVADRKKALAECAPLIYEARAEHFTDTAGAPDWRGRAWHYRQWYGEVMSLADIPASERQRLTTAIGYHVANYLRVRLDEETLKDLGISPLTPRERKRGYDKRRSELVRGLTGQRTGDESADGLARLRAIERILNGGIPSPDGDKGDEVAEMRALASSLALRLLTVAERTR